MRKIKRLVAVATIAMMALSITGCKMIAKTPEAIKKTVLATVDGDKITLGDVDAELASQIDVLKQQYGEDYEEKIEDDIKEQLKSARSQVLTQLINDAVINKKGEELKVFPAEDELKTEVEEERKQFVEAWGGEDNLPSALQYFGMTEESFNDYLVTMVKQQKVYDEVTKDITVSDEDISKYYEDNKSSYTTKAGANTRHILFVKEVADDATDEEKAAALEEAKAQADAAKAKIDSGETTFDALFTEYSGNKANSVYPISEDLKYVDYDKQGYDTDFLAGLKTLKEGEISAPVKSSFGYHIIEATGVNSEDKVTPLDEVKDTIKSQVEYDKKKTKFNSDVEAWKKDYKVKIYENRL